MSIKNTNLDSYLDTNSPQQKELWVKASSSNCFKGEQIGKWACLSETRTTLQSCYQFHNICSITVACRLIRRLKTKDIEFPATSQIYHFSEACQLSKFHHLLLWKKYSEISRRNFRSVPRQNQTIPFVNWPFEVKETHNSTNLYLLCYPTQ